jgi:hypothetical protein
VVTVTKIALITTTINVPRNLALWRDQLGDGAVFIVAGDKKSPHEDIEYLLSLLPGDNRYLRPEAQEGWEVSEVIGWNCIQRRNIALLEAIALNPDVIVTVDDDNWPGGWTTEYLSTLGENQTLFLTATQNGWYNVGAMLRPAVVHRGFPQEYRNTRPIVEGSMFSGRIGVHAGLWLGDPDIDAIERMVKDPFVTSILGDATLDLGTWSPFNSQSTAYLGKLAPLMFCFPGVGRMDDIWASYLARRVMDHLWYYAHYGHPHVRQDRNEHNLVRDVEAELLGYEFTLEVAEVLRQVRLENTDGVFESMVKCHDAMAANLSHILPEQTLSSLTAWQNDVRRALGA